MRRTLMFGLVLMACLVTACQRNRSAATAPTADTVPRAAGAEPPASATELTSPPLDTGAPTTPATAATTLAATTTTVTPTATSTIVTTTITPTTVPAPSSTPYGLPVADVDRASWGDTHSTYPASDIFVDCGADLVAPVNGTILEVRRENEYDPSIDNPATRGGRSLSILGDDGVRYYMAHFETIVEPLDIGDRIEIGQYLGTMGQTGRASACHVHFAISPPCPGKEWSVRRGVIWPYGYLDAWRRGEQLSPLDEVATWMAANPTACEQAMADPYAADS